MDLSSLVADLEDQKATSFSMRTGTPPFMAADLLRSSKIVPLYRHDLESLFCVLLLLCTRHQILWDGVYPRLVKRAAPPFNDWFDSSLSWEQLASTKNEFFVRGFARDNPTMNIDNIFPPESSFFGFKNWIIRLLWELYCGFRARDSYNHKVVAAEAMGVDPNLAPIDEETLDGHLQYSTFFDVMKSFAGKDLRGPPNALLTL
ncbi:hypothetical protein BDZ89DRAFT_540291 [Hymenopellis radicata]|nr:hypothetical protein BDZ89DRAFT_540291 [Hymenopellis radicata]